MRKNKEIESILREIEKKRCVENILSEKGSRIREKKKVCVRNK